MTVLKRWLIEWILKKPWLVTICPENFRIQMTLGRLFQFAGQNKTAYDAYCKAISAKTDAAAAYRSASRLAKEHPLRREWMSFLLEMKEKAKADNSIPLLYLLQEGTSITGDERMSLLFNAVGNSPNNASLIEKLVQEHIIQKRVEDLIKHEVLQHISILSSEQCRRLLNYALLASGEDAYTLLRDIFSRVNLSVPEMADINMQTIEDIIQLNLEEDGSGISVEKLKEFLRIHYFTNNYSDDELFRLAGKYKQWEPFCLEIAIEKLRFTGSVKLLIRTVEHILSLEDHEIIKGINL